MDRPIVYPGSIPLDTDFLSINRNTMVAVGYLMQAVFGTGTIVDGLACTPTVPASMSVSVGSGSICQLATVDTLSYGSLPANSAPLMKMGINLTSSSFQLTTPATGSQSINYIIQAVLLESDTQATVLPYYNAANPSQPFNGPANSGSMQSTLRAQSVQLQLKAGIAAPTGSQQNPVVDSGWVGLYQITVSYGQSAIESSSITPLISAPFLSWKLPQLRPGFGSGTQSFTTPGSYVVPAGVTQLEVELWGGGAGSFASVSGLPSGGGSGGGYAKRRITGLTPGQVIQVTVGSGGAAGTTSGGAAAAGSTSTFGSFVSATGGSLNYLATPSSPQNGATPAGTGVGGDVNLMGSAGQAAVLNQGGLGGASPMGGSQNSGTTGVPGVFPGGGASGAGTGMNGTTPYNGAAGAGGFVIVRW